MAVPPEARVCLAAPRGGIVARTGTRRVAPAYPACDGYVSLCRAGDARRMACSGLPDLAMLAPSEEWSRSNGDRRSPQPESERRHAGHHRRRSLPRLRLPLGRVGPAAPRGARLLVPAPRLRALLGHHQTRRHPLHLRPPRTVLQHPDAAPEHRAQAGQRPEAAHRLVQLHRRRPRRPARLHLHGPARASPAPRAGRAPLHPAHDENARGPLRRNGRELRQHFRRPHHRRLHRARRALRRRPGA